MLCGLSAGSPCWFREAVTAFHGPPQRVPGPGLLPYSNCAHYDGEPARRDSYHQFLGAGMPPGYAAGDGAALHFCGESLARVVSSRAKAAAYWVEEVGGGVSEVALAVRWLGGSRTVARGDIAAGYGADDGVGLLFAGTELVRIVASRAGSRAYRVDVGEDGVAVQTPLEPELLTVADSALRRDVPEDIREFRAERYAAARRR